MGKQLLFSITKEDCVFKYYKGSGKGGQKRNKTENCCQCTHKLSGAQASSEEGRSKEFNTKNAFKKMIDSTMFKNWLRVEIARKTGEIGRIEEKLEKEMKDNVQIEFKKDGLWVKE